MKGEEQEGKLTQLLAKLLRVFRKRPELGPRANLAQIYNSYAALALLALNVFAYFFFTNWKVSFSLYVLVGVAAAFLAMAAGLRLVNKKGLTLAFLVGLAVAVGFLSWGVAAVLALHKETSFVFNAVIDADVLGALEDSLTDPLLAVSSEDFANLFAQITRNRIGLVVVFVANLLGVGASAALAGRMYLEQKRYSDRVESETRQRERYLRLRKAKFDTFNPNRIT